MIQLEDGKTYVDGFGDQITVEQIYKTKAPYPFKGVDNCYLYSAYGSYCIFSKSKYDLIEEIKPTKNKPTKPATKNMKYKIEKNVPIPSVNQTNDKQGKAYILKQMKKGDSIFVIPDSKNERQRWSATAAYYNIKIITRKEGKGFRLWHGGKKK